MLGTCRIKAVIPAFSWLSGQGWLHAGRTRLFSLCTFLRSRSKHECTPPPHPQSHPAPHHHPPNLREAGARRLKMSCLQEQFWRRHQFSNYCTYTVFIFINVTPHSTYFCVNQSVKTGVLFGSFVRFLFLFLIYFYLYILLLKAVWVCCVFVSELILQQGWIVKHKITCIFCFSFLFVCMIVSVSS